MNLRIYSLALAALAAVSIGAGLLLRGRRKTPEQREQERRARLAATGRIVDGTVTDVQEISSDEKTNVQLLIYEYDVAGVSYAASQDITSLRQFIDLHSCRIGLPASIKYDPQNPGNSIVIAENWTGLRSSYLPNIGRQVPPLAHQPTSTQLSPKTS
jgi:Protein of unknown function (DUF3592)